MIYKIFIQDEVYSITQESKQLIDGTLIALMISGSRLYGIENEDSDYDIKGVYIPAVEDILLNTVRKKSVRHKVNLDGKDVEFELFNIYNFIDLCLQGQTVAFDMLHTPTNYLIIKTNLWSDIIHNKYRFYSKNASAFIGYAKSQAYKYMTKIKRYDILQEVINILKNKFSINDLSRMKDVWDDLPRSTYVVDDEDSPQGIKQIRICGKVFQETSYVSYVYPILQSYLNGYGKRVTNNNEVDFKSVAHAVRVVSELMELYTKSNITFPLLDRVFVKQVKNGKFDIEFVSEYIDRCIFLIDELLKISVFPDRPDETFWKDFLLNKIELYVGGY